MVDISEIIRQWEIDEPKYSKVGRLVFKFLKEALPELEILPEVTFRVKDLASIVKKIKKKNLLKEYSYQDLNDKLGIRVICLFNEEMTHIDSFLKENFLIRNIDYKKDSLDHNRLDYISNHYDVSIKVDNAAFKRYSQFKDLIFEIQVRTLNQHAWSNTSHAISYKQEAKLSDLLKRKVYRLLSLYEIADDEFSTVNTHLINDQDNFIYSLLRKTEGKFFKFARMDYDRDISLYTLKKISSYLTKSKKSKVLHEIAPFIQTHETKIRRIFNDNRKRYFELPFLTQPEIFLIWYLYVEHRYTITDNWDNDFDREELETIKILWGGHIC